MKPTFFRIFAPEMDTMRKLELLSPARNAEYGKAAISCGADAVYIGAPRFGARSSAGNSITEIADLCKYAHTYHARVYAAVNTIIYEQEIDEVRSIIYELYHAGVDALIIQDMGLTQLDLPPIALHASTQTHNYELERIQFLEKVGFSRIILARELSLNQIIDIRKQTSAELECFVHGALCVSLSGQCYMSSSQGGRSANRGECAQPCRAAYSLQDENGTFLAHHKHLLSLKDLNLSDHIASLAEAGVSSFKIEGRLKDISYVKNITSLYRTRLDALINDNQQFGRTSSGTTRFFFEPDAQRTFSRGFTTYIHSGHRDKISSFDTPKSIGKPVAKVKSVNPSWIETELYTPVVPGDGLCFFRKNQLEGFLLNRVEGGLLSPNRFQDNLEPGTLLYRNADKMFKDLMDQDVSDRRIAVKFTMTEVADGFLLTAVDEDNIEVSIHAENEKTEARNREASASGIERQLSKSGDTCFAIQSIEYGDVAKYFFAASWLNNLRRECLAALIEARLAAHKPLPRAVADDTIPYYKTELNYMANIANPLAEQFYSKHGVVKLDPAYEIQAKKENVVLMTTRHCLRFETGHCEKAKGNLHPAEWTLNDGKNSFKLEFDCARCMMLVKAMVV